MLLVHELNMTRRNEISLEHPLHAPVRDYWSTSIVLYLSCLYVCSSEWRWSSDSLHVESKWVSCKKFTPICVRRWLNTKLMHIKFSRGSYTCKNGLRDTFLPNVISISLRCWTKMSVVDEPTWARSKSFVVASRLETAVSVFERLTVHRTQTVFVFFFKLRVECCDFVVPLRYFHNFSTHRNL